MAAQMAGLLDANEALAARLAKLEHLLSRNSKNSSSPPSKDDDLGKTPPAPAASKRRGGAPKRKRGKQPGAPGANLAWRESPDESKDRFPEGCCGCGADLTTATDLGVVDRYQQHEIPQVSVKVTQYDQHRVRCECGTIHTCAARKVIAAGQAAYPYSLMSPPGFGCAAACGSRGRVPRPGAA
jgi:transposase